MVSWLEIPLCLLNFISSNNARNTFCGHLVIGNRRDSINFPSNEFTLFTYLFSYQCHYSLDYPDELFMIDLLPVPKFYSLFSVSKRISILWAEKFYLSRKEQKWKITNFIYKKKRNHMNKSNCILFSVKCKLKFEFPKEKRDTEIFSEK